MIDELDDRNDDRTVLTVSQLTRAVRSTLEGQFSGVWIEGEISNYRAHGSGHHYFTLKDESSQISCVLFRGQARHLSFQMADGQRVQARGNVSVYEARGQYQLIVQFIQPKGIGDLQARFEALKRKLQEDGLFDAEHKQALPVFPRTIAVVTSPTGAAIRDILNVIRRRAPWVNVVVVPVRVQGAGAELEIATAIRGLSERLPGMPEIDLVIAGRGGGGMEDLWNFNEEAVARAIFACPIPVISAVGHEIDFTIADFVADVRAPTPSAAAELAVPEGAELAERLREATRRIESGMETRLASANERLNLVGRTLLAHEPRSAVANGLQKLDFLSDRLEGVLSGEVEKREDQVERAGRRLESWSPDPLLAQSGERIEALVHRLNRGFESRLGEIGEKLSGLGASLRALSPEAVFQRGFSLTLDAEGKPVISVSNLEKGDRIHTRVAEGEFDSVVD